MKDRFSTLTFQREIAAPLTTLWQAWIAPAARAIWSPPGPGVSVELLETSTEVGGREVSICRAAGTPDIRAEVRWLHLDAGRMSVNSELITSQTGTDGAALVTAEFSGDASSSRIALTVQLASVNEDMRAGYTQGYAAGIGNLASVAERTMVLTRVIRAPVGAVWGAWMNSETLPKWWGPDGFSCKTSRIDLRSGGEWVFDMIAPDGTVFPNHHKYGAVIPEARLEYTLHWGENGPKHADAWAMFSEDGGATRVTLGMVFATAQEFNDAKGFGAVELGLQTLGKLASYVGAP